MEKKSEKGKTQNEKGDSEDKGKGTNIVPDIPVGAGIDQKPHTHRVTIPGGPNQRRRSALSVGFARKTIAAHTRSTISDIAYEIKSFEMKNASEIGNFDFKNARGDSRVLTRANRKAEERNLK